MSTEENYSNVSHVQPEDPTLPPPITKGPLGLPPAPSNLITVDNPTTFVEKKADAQLEDPSNSEAKAEMYKHFKAIREHVCPLDSHCTKVDPRAILLGDSGAYTNSRVSEYEQTGRQRLALGGGEFTA